MSVSLVVLRLEVSDKARVPKLKYTAPGFHFGDTKDESHLTYAEVAGNTQGPITAGTFERYRGRRAYTEFVIESFFTEEAVIEEPPEMDESVKVCDMDKKHGNKHEKDGKIMANKPKLARQISAEDKKQSNIDKQVSVDGAKASTSQDGIPSHTRLKKSASPTLEEDSDLDEKSDRGHARSQSPQIPSTIRFFSGNPSVENTEGILHLYKNNPMTSLTDDVPRSEMICILTVPASMNSQDLLRFIAPVEPNIESVKVIRDGMPNKYMVLIKFKDQKCADEFYTNYNNRPFNMIEPEICHLVYVAKVETVKGSEGGSLPVSGLTELPVCPVCLERMDESVDGILTILCNHSFHSSCLAQWGDTSCPVCRYVQTPEPVEDHICFECESQESLWICLVCGHVGCGRYVGGHAYRHFQETQHCYSMQLGNNRVWDYAGDNYVHRLIQNKGDGKLVEVDEGGNVVQEEKLDSITLEYTYLLTSQLESQRHYFEEKIEQIEKENLKQIEESEERSKKTLEECVRLEKKLALTNKEKQCNEKKLTQLQGKMTKVLTELTEEREINKSLQQNQVHWQLRVTNLEKKLEEKDKDVKDLQEQLRDIMFYLEAQQKLASTTEISQEEIQEGQVILGAAAEPKVVKKGRKKGR